MAYDDARLLKPKMSEAMMRDRVQAGDLLFFTSSGCAGFWNRLCMGTKFDHVTMILKNPALPNHHQDMIMFEIAKGSKAKVYQWGKFVPGDY